VGLFSLPFRLATLIYRFRSKVIEELKHAHLVAYFYMSHGKLYSASELTATLLKQLCLQRGIVPARLRQLYEHSKGGTGRLLRLVDMLSALKETSQAIVQPTVVIVDGLDEINMSQRQDFVRILDELRQTSWKCLVTSRSHQDVLTETPRGYTQFSIIEVETTRHIQDFVERILAGNEPIDQMLSNQSDLCAEVINTLTSRSHGM